MLTTIPLDRLDDHPDNANHMPEPLLAKLIAHLRGGGRYPALIVRPHGHDARGARHQILDGHHRAEALRRLGQTLARCEVWPVDDEQAALLLLTLNRLRGSDDPARRGRLLESLSASTGLASLARRVPESAAQIRRLVALTKPPPPPAPPPDPSRLPQAVTFFLTPAQRDRLVARLEAIAPERSQALVALLGLDDASEVTP